MKYLFLLAGMLLAIQNLTGQDTEVRITIRRILAYGLSALLSTDLLPA